MNVDFHSEQNFSQQLFQQFHSTKQKMFKFKQHKLSNKQTNEHFVEIDVVRFYPIEKFLNQQYKSNHWPINLIL